MIKYLYCLLLLFGTITLAAQDHLDRVWLGGYRQYPDLNIAPGQMRLYFDGQVPSVEPMALGMNFEGTLAVVPDEAGNLLFYSNGCRVANAAGLTMPNGDGLNPGAIADQTCPDVGYIAPRGAMALPAPGHDGQYYLLHLGLRYDTLHRLSYGPFYFSRIDMSLDGGLGDVVEKNQVPADGRLESFDAVRHGNGRDWWILLPEYASNRYRVFLLSPAGLTEQPMQQVGPALACKRLGSTAFSPDGRRYARFQNCRAVVFHFDRCSGQLTYDQAVDPPEHLWGGGGLAFSPDGETLYFTSQNVLWQTDLTANPALPDTAIMLDYDWGTNLHQLEYGPDGRLFVSLMNRAAYLNAFELPGVSGGAGTFLFQAINLPVQNVRTLPHFPNFRLFDWPGSACDTLGVNGLATVPQERPIRLWPNPAGEMVYVQGLAAPMPARLILYDMTGRVLLDQAVTLDQAVSLTTLPNGIFGWQVLKAGRCIATGRLIHQP